VRGDCKYSVPDVPGRRARRGSGRGFSMSGMASTAVSFLSFLAILRVGVREDVKRERQE
jgi:hypothetical protein